MSQVIPLRLKMSNAFLIKGKRLALVDTGSPKDISALVDALEKTGTGIQELSLIVNTHAHLDHCGCTADLQDLTGALVIIHRADKVALSQGANSPIIPINMFGRALMPFLRGQYRPAKPDIVIDDEFDLHPYGVNGVALSTPGHTPGSISVILDSGEAIVGDLFGGGRLLGLLQPGRPRYHHWYADLSSAKVGIARVMKKAPTRIFVGHGGPIKGEMAVEYFCNLQ